MQYPSLGKELSTLLKEDQRDIKVLADLHRSKGGTRNQAREKVATEERIAARTSRALVILDEIKEPSLSNIGYDGALALSVLALHASLANLERIFAAFQELCDRDKENCPYDLIPAMNDWVLVQKGLPQEFGTQWLFDEYNYPFLPTIARFTTFDELNARRAAYGREPHRWPKSLAMPETEQPWLKRPLSEAVMRMPTREELERVISRK